MPPGFFSKYTRQEEGVLYLQISSTPAKGGLFLMSTGSEGRLTRSESQGIHMGLLHDWKLPEGFLYTEKTVYPSFLWSPSPSHNSHNLTLLSWPQTSQSHPAYPMIPLPTDFPSSIKVLSLSRLKELANLEDPSLRHTTLWIFPFVLLCFSLSQLICPHRSKMLAFWLQDQLYCDFRRSQQSLSLVHKVHWPSSTMWLELSASLTNSQSPKLLF